MKMMKISLIFFLCLVSCSPIDSTKNEKYEIVSTPIFKNWFKENCDQCFDLENQYTNPGNFRGVKKFEYHEKTYVLVNSGMKPNGGYSIQINNIKEEADAVIIEAEDISPSNNSSSLAVETNPTVLIIFNSTKKDVQVKWR
ncbi:protease complex subunit PrcB family protein [Paenibacillus periandrae]|uniref:protease complex subunit PrcB family protein n=1 Tax=Paenibacillus periandrae TaxID=1761741 RepID=UPI001F095EDC|nr:protease complex subunit PrcB family protein [Paenibacillus periandrae]